LLQQLVEKIDRVREVAGRQLQTFFKYSAHLVCDFSDKDRLMGLFLQEDSVDDGGAISTMAHDHGIGYLAWRSAEFVFSQIQIFFPNPVYNIAIFRGLITCSGGLSESTLKAS
jgi:Tubulin folding cofactor D C terminal